MIIPALSSHNPSRQPSSSRSTTAARNSAASRGTPTTIVGSRLLHLVEQVGCLCLSVSGQPATAGRDTVELMSRTLFSSGACTDIHLRRLVAVSSQRRRPRDLLEYALTDEIRELFVGESHR
jgi:hypothetical protein